MHRNQRIINDLQGRVFEVALKLRTHAGLKIEKICIGWIERHLFACHFPFRAEQIDTKRLSKTGKILVFDILATLVEVHLLNFAWSVSERFKCPCD
jgi:hypothetical protein